MEEVNMYAVVQIGSSQYKISQGDTIETNRLKHEVGKDFALDKVLLFANHRQLYLSLLS